MAKKRTRKEKIIAKLRREVSRPAGGEGKNPVLKPDGFVVSEMTLPVNLLQADLTKTGVVAILAWVLQGGLFWYLNQAGRYQALLDMITVRLK